MKTHCAFLLFLIPLLMLGAAAPAAGQDLADLDLATLMSMDVTVTTAAKREQATSDAPAAVYVITREDIRRSGATSLPEVLRLAPGVQVARINTRSWAVTARGFNSRFANKLLVMIDGRSIYTPVFSGVIWEEQSVFLDEIERIEIVRGPGGALWGINAVNGVINIITRKAADSRGLYARTGAGSEHNHTAALRYGGRANAIGDYRLYVDHNEVASIEANAGAPWTRTQAGWRLDRVQAVNSFTFQGDVTRNDFGDVPEAPAASLPATAQVGNVSASWQRSTAPGQLDIRSYYGWVKRGVPAEWQESNFGFDAQFNADRVGPHLLTSGIGYRYTVDEMNNSWTLLTLSRPKVRQHQWSVYGQDEIHFFDDNVRFTVGAKLEDLEFTGLAFQPTVRGLWHLTDSHTVWAAASRAVRTPSRIELHSQTELGFYSPDGLVMMRVLGNDSLVAEDLRAYELGWRWRPYRALSIDVSLYRNEYEHLIDGDSLPPVFEPGPPPRLVVPSVFANIDHTRVEGAEIVAEWAARDWLRLEAQGTWLDSTAARGGTFPGPIDPQRMFRLGARLDLPRGVEFDVAWRSVSDLAGLGIDGYRTLDARAAWRPVENIELSLAIDNAFNDEHIEFDDNLAFRPGATLGRSYFARFTWQPRR